MTRTAAEWSHAFERKDALWIHYGNPLRPHALLTGGKHSNGYIQCKPVTDDDALLCDASIDLLAMLESRFKRNGFDIDRIDVVVGPATGATRLAQAMRDRINERGGKARAVALEKIGTGPGKRFSFPDGERIRSGEYVLLVDDVLTTGSSLRLAMDEIREGIVYPYTAALANRSGFSELCGMRVVSLIEEPLRIWAPDKCLLCKKGSAATRPEEEGNWERLTRPYPQHAS